MPTINKQKTAPCLWFDTQAEDAAKFYTSVFDNSRIKTVSRYGKAGREVHGKEAGTVMVVEFELEGQTFLGLNGGPLFKFSEAVSFQVYCDSQREIDYFRSKLSEGGREGQGGWLKDRYGLSWQIVSSFNKQKIAPCLWFDTQAEDAAKFYTSVFDNSRIKTISRYGKAGREVHGKEAGTVMVVEFELEGQTFLGLNGGPQFKFSEAVSFPVYCDTQREIDHFWSKLSEGGQEGQCGWLKDKFGLSWQVVPSALPQLMTGADGAATDRMTNAIMTMKKFDLETLQRAHAG